MNRYDFIEAVEVVPMRSRIWKHAIAAVKGLGPLLLVGLLIGAMGKGCEADSRRTGFSYCMERYAKYPAGDMLMVCEPIKTTEDNSYQSCVTINAGRSTHDVLKICGDKK